MYKVKAAKSGLLVCSLVAALAFQPKNSAAQSDEGATVRVNGRTMAERASEALTQARGLELPGWRETNDLIVENRFSEFEGRSKKFEELLKTNPLYESPLFKLYEILGGASGRTKINDSIFVAELDKWVDTRPSYMALSARGLYKVNLGFRQRGGEYVRNTPEEKIAEMRRSHLEARADLIRALKDNPKFPIPYIGLIRIERASGNIEDATMWMDLASKEIPYTYYVRYMYLESLTPRWGGSYASMESFTFTLDSAAQGNPRIWSLKGEPYAERGYSSILRKDYSSAIAHYTKALSYGDRREFYYWRGRSYMDSGQKREALADFAKCLKIASPDSEIDGYIRDLSK